MKKTIKIYKRNSLATWKGINEKGEIIYDRILGEIRHIRIEPDTRDKKITKICKHDELIHIGYWDGLKECGPITKCKLCGKEIYLTWEEWNAIPKEKKVPIEDTPWMKKRRKIMKKTREVIEETLSEPEIANMEPEEFVKRYDEFIEKMERNIKRRVKITKNRKIEKEINKINEKIEKK